MNWLNYHHLHYFWAVVREGGITNACKVLHLTQPTVSKQIKQLEEQLGEPLFKRVSRTLELTEAGQMAYDYADEIFSLGQEFMENMQGVASVRPRRLRVGISSVLPKLISHRILQPIVDADSNIHLICEEDHTNRLLAELSIQRLDLVLTDAPIAGTAKVKAFNHFLGDCGITFFATAALAKTLKGSFPKKLDGAQFLALSDSSLTRRSLERWFDSVGIRPRILAEFEDSALMKVFGRDGTGVFAAPTVIASEICRELGVKALGSTEAVRESFYAITIERKFKHPAVARIAEVARKQLFGTKTKK
ncbi:MAG: transcriptional activator NhaR [Limisphaerales bacterium]